MGGNERIGLIYLQLPSPNVPNGWASFVEKRVYNANEVLSDIQNAVDIAYIGAISFPILR